MKRALLTLLLVFSVSAGAAETCFYPSKQDDGSYDHFDACGLIEGDQIKLAKAHAENVLFNEHGLACVIMSPADTFYIHDSGRSQRVYFYDNGCDYFKEGLARGLVDGEMVFINPALDTVLAPGFELISHFNYGHSVVCNGPFEEEKHGEHTFLTGGKCGLIDKQGDLVVEARYKIEDRDVFQTYLNTHNHCPPPPVTSENSALCHAKRHVSNMDYQTGEWKRHTISDQGEIWIITFVEVDEPDEELTLILQSASAQWDSLIKESHDEALQRTKY
ncbi:hypothetical protein [Allohahella marinimesophila]|uniref:WG repeat protein n=1 Tax=Allohahella marinimesophila TaxID=1054972 RepID=A0ABP7NYP7_9GAMM